MKEYGVIVIGGGPAGQMAAIETAKSGLATVLIDKGRTFSDSLCYRMVKQTRNTTLKEPYCLNQSCLEGLGGAAFHFEANLDNYPFRNSQSSGLTTPFSNSLVEAFGDTFHLAEVVSEVYQRFFSYGLTAPQGSPGIIPVNIATIKKIGGAMENDMKASNVEVILEEEFLEIIPSKEGYTVNTRNKYGSSHSIFGEKVIFATGKRSFKSLLLNINTLGIVYKFPEDVELGVRVEVPREWLMDMLSDSPNPKINSQGSNNECSRSFCFCDGGRLMSYSISNAHREKRVLDGQHANTNKGPKTNFAILSKIRVPDDKNSIDHVIDYIDACNTRVGGVPAQLFIDYVNNRESKMRDVYKIQPTLSGLCATNLRNLLQEYGVDILGFLNTLSDFVGKEIPKETLIVAPAAEKYLPQIKLKSNFESGLNGIYFVGDCSGIVSGIVSAAATGLRAGRSIVREEDEN